MRASLSKEQSIVSKQQSVGSRKETTRMTIGDILFPNYLLLNAFSLFYYVIMKINFLGDVKS